MLSVLASKHYFFAFKPARVQGSREVTSGKTEKYREQKGRQVSNAQSIEAV